MVCNFPHDISSFTGGITSLCIAFMYLIDSFSLGKEKYVKVQII